MSTPALLSRLVSDIVARLGRRYWLYVLLVALTGLMEAVSLASAVPLLAAAGVGTGAPAGGSLGRLAAAVVAAVGVAPTVVSIGGFVLLALLASTALFVAQAYIGASLQTAYVYRWQERLLESIFRARWTFVAGRRQGELINAVVTETQRLGGAFYQASLLLTGIAHGVLFLALSAALSAVTTALVIAGGAVLFVLTRPLIHRAYGLGTGIVHENAALQSLAGELVSGGKLVKATATEGHALQLLTGTAHRLRGHYLSNTFDVQIVKAVFDFGAAAMAAGILVATSSVTGSDPAVVLVVLAIFVRLMPKLTGVQHSLQALSVSLPALEQVQALAREADEQREPLAAEQGMLPTLDGPLAVELRGVDLFYGPVAALSSVTLSIEPGSCVALVGGSGAGKSSLVDAVLGLTSITSGDIRINGVPLQDLPLAALRRRVGYMGQDSVLYNGTIGDNVLWGRQQAGAAALAAALRLAGATEFVNRLPLGVDTPVGDRGALLSGGERQRIALARAGLGSPGLLILDESTSALDAETERSVTDALAALKGRTTVIVIAHRLSSIRMADKVCVMEQGRIVEHGPWEQLMQRRGRLHQLWTLQHADERGADARA